MTDNTSPSPTLASAGFARFIGVDVGKAELVACLHGGAGVTGFANSAAGIDGWLAAHAGQLADAYVVVDATGGWERTLIAALLAKGATVHRADGRKVKSFARSLGVLAKTDALDARLLARYGHDRHRELSTAILADEQLFLLKGLVTRRSQVALYAKEEKQRLSGPLPERVRFLTERHLDCLGEEIDAIETEIHACIHACPALRGKAELMMKLQGIGPLTAALLLAEMPELGQLDGKQIASLAGLAPHAHDSGKMNGKRTTWGGRKIVKSALFLAALNAVKAKEKDNRLRAFYQKLLANGKSKRCALIATARKIIVILNARLKEKFFLKLADLSR